MTFDERYKKMLAEKERRDKIAAAKKQIADAKAALQKAKGKK